MAGELTPNVTVVQQIGATPTVVVTPTLVPCVAGVCNQIVEALDASGGLNSEARYDVAQYNQGDVFVPQANFPNPRGNLDEINIDEGTVRAFLNFGGSLRELPRGSNGHSGEAFLVFGRRYHLRPTLLSTVADSFTFDGTVGDVLVVALDVANPTDTSKDVIITFVGTLTVAQVVTAINAAVGATVARAYVEPASNPYSGDGVSVGDQFVQIFSTRASARGSITVRPGASALPILFGAGFDSTKTYRIEGSGFRGQDDGDGDLVTPWIELHPGGYYVDGVSTAFPANALADHVWAALIDAQFPGADENKDEFTNAKVFTSMDFTDTAASSFPLKAATATTAGDQLYADGVVLSGGAEIIRVEATRFRMGVLDTARSVFDADGTPTSRVYTSVEVNLPTHPQPFTPAYVWFKARGLQFPGDGTGVAAALTGSVAAEPARPAIVQGTTEITFGGGLSLAGLSLLITVTDDGVALDQQTVLFAGGPYADMSALLAALTSALSSAGLGSLVTASATGPTGNRLVLQTSKSGADQGLSIASTGTANTSLKFSTSAATASVGVDEEIYVAPEVTGAHISLPLVGLSSADLEITVTDNYGTHIVLAEAVDLEDGITTLGDLKEIIADAFGNPTPTDGILYDGVIPVAVVTTSGDSDAHGTLTISAFDGGADVTISISAASGADGFRHLGFHDDDGDNWAELTSAALTLPMAALDTKTLALAYNPGSVALSATLGAPEAAATTAAGLAALLNAMATLTSSGGSRKVWFVGNNTTGRLLVRTIAGGTSTNIDMTITAGSAGLELGYDGVLVAGTADGSNADDTGADGLRAKSLRLSLDYNPSVYEISLPANSIPLCVDEINNVIGAASAIASMTSGRYLKITSALLGAPSAVLVVGGTAQSVLGLSGPSGAFGSGRPLPDFYLDDAGSAHIGPQILRDRLGGVPFQLVSALADIYLQYTALRQDVTAMASSPGLLSFDDTASIDAAIGPINPANPLALGLFLAKANAPAVPVSGIGIDDATAAAPDGTLDGWVRCLEYIESKEIYALAPLQGEPAITALIRAHVLALSQPEMRGERIGLCWGAEPSRTPPATVASGTGAETNGISNSITLDSNPSDELVSAGIDVGSEIPVADGVYFEAILVDGGSSRLVRYSVKNVSGVVLTFRTTFASGENTDGFYTSTTLDGLAGYVGIDWSLKIRGETLLIPGTSITDLAALARAVAGEATPYASRRLYLGYAPFVDVPIDGIAQRVPGYYLMACVAGMIAGRSPRLPLHLVPIGGVSKVYGTDDKLGKHMDTAADGGRMLFINDGASVVCRHARSTDSSAVETRELSITTQIDWIAKGFRTLNRDFLRGRVITPGLITELGIANQGFCQLVTGTVVEHCRVDSILQDEQNKDRILVNVEADPSYPANRIRVTIVV